MCFQGWGIYARLEGGRKEEGEDEDSARMGGGRRGSVATPADRHAAPSAILHSFTPSDNETRGG